VLAPAIRDLAFSIDDFVCMGIFSKASVGLAVAADSPWKTLGDLVADAKKSPGKYKYATPGVGALPHFLVEFFNRKAGINTVVMPVKSDAEVVTSLLGGHVAFGTLIDTSAVVHVTSGKVRLLATLDSTRSKFFPDVPTGKELGYDVEGPILCGLAAPKGTPKAVIDKVYGAMKKAFDDKKLQPLVEKSGWTPILMTPEEMDKRFRQEAAFYSKLAKELGIEIK
jgi:tripartite-type tricarboxylate transporter receptor subunit TctC